ncbi:MAG TPA: nickel-responsive transcriptional regulator NikR [Spirochaetota bacterium]
MGKVTRFGVSLKPELLRSLDDYSVKRKFTSRSQAIAFIVEDALANQSYHDNKTVCGALVIMYDHHRTDFMTKFVSIQHDYQKIIMASQHIHVDHHNCLETITLKGKASELQKLADTLLALKGVKHGKLVRTSL